MKEHGLIKEAISKIRVSVTESQPLVRAGLSQLLASYPDIEVVASVPDCKAARSELDQHELQLLLLCLSLPDPSALSLLNYLRCLPQPPRALILSTFTDDEFAIRCLRAGALGYLLQDISPETLVQAIRNVARGEITIIPRLGARLISEYLQLGENRPATAAYQPAYSEITNREIEILQLVANGENNREISQRLIISEGTVKNYISSLLSKLGMRDRTQLALYGRQFQMAAS
jgi:DNA-binding NarL/FixJ family response regulator